MLSDAGAAAFNGRLSKQGKFHTFLPRENINQSPHRKLDSLRRFKEQLSREVFKWPYVSTPVKLEAGSRAWLDTRRRLDELSR